MHPAQKICRNLSVETTDYCNQKCGYCNQTNKISSMHGAGFKNEFMDPALFKRVVDRMSEKNPPFDSFTPYWSGEPLLHPKTADFFRYLFQANRQKKFFKSFLMNTNAVYLTQEISNLLLDYAGYIESEKTDGGIHMTFSLDSVNPKTYSQIRRVSEYHLSKALANIDCFLELRAQRGLRKPSLTYQFVVCEENFFELEDTLQFWKQKLEGLKVPYEIITEVSYFNDRDAIFFRQLDDGRYIEGVRAKKLHERAIHQLGLTASSKEDTLESGFLQNEEMPEQADWLKRKKPCFQLWNMLVMAKDGTVVPCCKDLFFELKLGSIQTQSFAEMWHGQKLQEMRLDQIQGNFEKYQVCSNCIHPPGGELTVSEVIDYLCGIDRTDLIEPYLDRILSPVEVS